jgi:hypothetical protein
MVVRSALLEAGYRFDPTIGTDGSEDQKMGSETDFIKRMVRGQVRVDGRPGSTAEKALVAELLPWESH